MTLKRLDATTALEGTLLVDAAGSSELPHLNRLVETAADKLAGIGRECDAVDAVLVAVRTLKTLEQIAHLDIPDPDALIERSSSDVLGVGRDGDGSNAVLYRKR